MIASVHVEGEGLRDAWLQPGGAWELLPDEVQGKMGFGASRLADGTVCYSADLASLSCRQPDGAVVTEPLPEDSGSLQYLFPELHMVPLGDGGLLMSLRFPSELAVLDPATAMLSPLGPGALESFAWDRDGGLWGVVAADDGSAVAAYIDSTGIHEVELLVLDEAFAAGPAQRIVPEDDYLLVVYGGVQVRVPRP